MKSQQENPTSLSTAIRMRTPYAQLAHTFTSNITFLPSFVVATSPAEDTSASCDALTALALSPKTRPSSDSLSETLLRPLPSVTFPRPPSTRVSNPDSYSQL